MKICNCSVLSQVQANCPYLRQGQFACMSRDFGIFMAKHLAKYYLLNSYENIGLQEYTKRGCHLMNTDKEVSKTNKLNG